VDFSAGDTGEDYMIVRSYMAHHVGMSMLACVNALRGGLFVRRFMRDPAMAGAESLLMEKIPADAPVYRPPHFNVPKKRLPERRVPPPAGAFSRASAYSNGEVTLVCD
jgi:cyclic beta-1,2-glucan synthetase